MSQTEQENPSLLLATVAMVRVHRASFDLEPSGVRTPQQLVHLNKKKVCPAHSDEARKVWALDTAASNGRAGRGGARASLDTSVHGTVRFGDGSLVEIEGIGSVVLQTKEGHTVLTEVYYIPKIKSNIVS